MTVRDERLHVHGGTGHRLLKKAILAVRLAEKLGYDALVFVVDEDGDPDRRRQLDRAQDYLEVGIRRAMGLAVRTFDAWMLADEQALSDVLGRHVQRQPDPESIRDAKTHCANLRADFPLGMAEFYARLATVARPDVIEKRCPAGFGPFATRLRRW